MTIGESALGSNNLERTFLDLGLAPPNEVQVQQSTP